jgi:hypothetical protein
MKFTRTRAIIACTLLAGVLASPAFGQGVIARGDCPKAMRMMGHAPTPTPAPSMSYKPVDELERYVASLQAKLQAAAPQPQERPRTKRAKRLPSPI